MKKTELMISQMKRRQTTTYRPYVAIFTRRTAHHLLDRQSGLNFAVRCYVI